jgi:hypothetical protein
MRTGHQFTVFLENKPGRLSNICTHLAREKVSIQALTVMDSKEHSVLRMVVDRANETRELLRKLGSPFSETEIIMVDLKHSPGALANICEKLASEHVNIDYMYCSSGPKNGRTLVVLKATPLDKVRHVLSGNATGKLERTPVRRAPVRR